MIIKTAIADHDEKSVSLFKSYLERYAGENKEPIEFETTCFKDGDELASDYYPRYDIIFIEIQPDAADGMSAARQIRKFDQDVMIVFVAHSAEYALEGYSVGAYGFLLKPLSYSAIEEQLIRSVKKLQSNRFEYIVIPTDAGIVRMDISKIIFIESFQDQAIVYTEEKVYKQFKTIEEFENKLLNKHFFRCSQNHLINLAYVNAVKNDKVLIDKHSFMVSQSRKRSFIKALINYGGKIVR